ncbi:HNH endonuclease [Nocardioides seonyuensis]|uniref:HNH endonuclease n=1 Tax=Nocardioides seonyuensis TaxID=2518371 RepID=A0A4P7ICX9_9ACTN|nr:HNH endonuclease signature motif containing protein [Nocardioides seonyuensis]QBX54490.1 HNH endonuclease [Nocardioides seonyuensis]
MTSSTTLAAPVPGRPVLDGLSSTQLMAHAGEVEQLSRQVEVARLEVALEWAITHPVVEASSSVLETPDQPGGAGTPEVAAFATDTLAVAMGIAPLVSSRLVADALDLSFRLPLLWDLTRALRIPAARARRVAGATRDLSAEGARWVDRQVAAASGRVSSAQLDRIVAHATAQFDPDALKTRQDRARETWGVDLHHPTPGDFAGTSTLTARGDSIDLARFHDVVNAEADTLAALGDTDTLGQRQAKALGVIAAQQAALDLTDLIAGQQCDDVQSDDRVAVRARALARSQVKVKLFLHASLPDLLTRGHDDLVGTADTLGPVTLAKVKEWVGHSRVTIVPVLHVAADDTWTVDRHDPPPRMAETVRLRDETCVFPRCGRHARGCDLDHITPYDTGPPDTGPPTESGGTTAANLAPLCRRHHRAKTSGAWTYQRLAPGTYLWTGPADIATLVTPDDVIDL